MQGLVGDAPEAADGLLTIAPASPGHMPDGAEPDAPPHIADRYIVVDKLGEGGMGVVYSARDRLTGQHVAIKRVRIAAPARPGKDAMPTALAETRSARTTAPGGSLEGSRPALMALAREFRTLASIRHPHIISVLDYGFGPSREPYFTMELLADARPLQTACEGLPVVQQVRLILQVLEALTYVHRRGVLHRDLKPANVLVLGDGADARVKVLDFGIACVREPVASEALAGTIAYMAPELFWGSPASEATDLWAVAVMAHEILLGAHPFSDRDADESTAPIADTPPAPALARHNGELASVLQRALTRSPLRRQTDLSAFARELARAVGLPPPAESAESRDSFLSAAAFVARRSELATLRQALGEAIGGRGSLWLVGGESGIGKSRLLDELRTIALVGGNRVVRGQAISAGGAAYQVWQGALRPLCLEADLDDLAASVLLTAVPDLAALLRRPIPEPPAIDPHAAETRFIVAVEQLLRRQSAPLVLLLEDLHWAEPASILVLQRLARALPHLPILVVASYRDDERQTLPSELPTASRLSLRRLSTDEVALLSGAMLGDAGKSPALVALLERETEGNAFFVVEVLRALAEEAGTLDRVGEHGLPAQVTAGGVQAVLARRLDRAPARARPLLTAAAVLGRELDLRVLAELTPATRRELEEDLAACAANSVLEVHQDGLRFAHDKLRSELLRRLPADERAAWHGRVALALERVHDGELGPHVAALAHHWQHADDPRREAPYRIQAGERASRGGAVGEAIVQLERARLLVDRPGAAPADRTRILGLLVRTYHAADRPEEAFALLEHMLADIGHATPPTRLGLLANIGRRLGARALHRLWPATRPAEHDPGRLATISEIGASVLAIAEGAGIVRSPTQLTSAALDFLVMAERARDPILLIPAYLGLWFMFSLSPAPRLGAGYWRRAQALLADLPPDRDDVRAYADVVHAAVHIHRGEWDAALARLDDELGHRRRMGDWRAEVLTLTQGHFTELLRGEMAGALQFLDQLEQLERRLAAARPFWGARCLRAQLDLRSGDLEHAAAALAEADAQLTTGRDQGFAVIVDGLGAVCALRQGDRPLARRRADAALARLLASPPIHYGLLEIPPAVLEVYGELWAASDDPHERATLAAQTERCLAALRRFAINVVIVRPRALLCHGRWAELRGHPRRAAWYFTKALARADELHMPFEQALAHAALARLAPATEHARLATDLFTQLGARWHLEP